MDGRPRRVHGVGQQASATEQATGRPPKLRRTRWWLHFLLLAALLLPQGVILAAPATDIAPGCVNLVENGGFETISPHWQIEPGPRPAMYTNEATFNNSAQSMRVGNGAELSNTQSVSEVRYRPVLFPRDAERIILRFRYQPRYDAPPGEDLQQADLYYYNSNQLAFSLLNVQENSATWKLVERELTAYRGQLLSLRFRVWNDGLQGRTWLYVDNVEIEYCTSGPIRPTAMPTWTATGVATESPSITPSAMPSVAPSATPYPTVLPTWTPNNPSPTFSPLPGCNNILRNGGFEDFGDWFIGQDPVPPRYSTEQAHSGARSMILGNPPGFGPDVETYSSIRQRVDVPGQATGIQLRWWQWAYTQEAPASNAPATADTQEVILLAPDDSVVGILARQRSNDGNWQQRAVDLSPYRGQRVSIYFNVYNNANSARTWMFVDDVELVVCGLGSQMQANIQPLEQQIPFNATLTAPIDTPMSTPVDALTPANLPAPLPSATPLALAEQPAAATATVETPVVEILTTPAAGAATPRLRQPVATPELPATQPWWRQWLGTLAIMCSVPVLILIIIVLIIQIRRLGQPQSP